MVTALQRRTALAVTVGVVAVAVSSLWWGLRTVTHFGLPSPAGLRTVRHSLQSSRPILAGFHLPLAHTAGIVVLCRAGRGDGGGGRSGDRHPVPRPLVGTRGSSRGVVGDPPSLGRRRACRTRTRGIRDSRTGERAVRCSSDLAGGSGSFAGDRCADPGLDSCGRLQCRFAGRPVGSCGCPLGLVAGNQSHRSGDPGRQRRALQSEDARVYLLAGHRADRLRGQPVGPRPGHLRTFERLRGSPSGRAATGTASVQIPSHPGRLQRPTLARTSVDRLGVGRLVAGGHLGRRRRHRSPPTRQHLPGQRGCSLAGDRLPVHAPSIPSETATGPLPDSVRSLALAITGDQSTPLDKAEALIDYFRSGRFHYAIDTPQPVGGDPLVSFLTQTRTGSCEQFAGAFAVLARASGLPTRVAVGFTPGRTVEGVTVVRGSDAHAWPQVLINGSWVSFEPTPQLPSGELSPPGVLGPSGLGQPNPTGPGSHPPVSLPIVTTPHPTAPPVTIPPAAPTHHVASRVGWWIALLLVIGIAAVAAAAWRRHRRAPIGKVLGSWDAIDRALARRGLARPPWRTPMGHVRSLEGLQGSDQAIAALADMATVATVLEDATFGSGELLPDDVDRAARASRRARQAMRAGALCGATESGFTVYGAGDLSTMRRDR